MSIDELKDLVRGIVSDAEKLKNAYTDAVGAPVNYACIFAQTPAEYEEIENLLIKFGKRVQETSAGFVYSIPPMETSAGDLQLLKLRKPDPTKPERGDADFTVADYPGFKDRYLSESGFSLIERPNMEMIELVNPAFNVRVYFSNPPLGQVLGI